jgi:hypothetical protein
MPLPHVDGPYKSPAYLAGRRLQTKAATGLERLRQNV